MPLLRSWDSLAALFYKYVAAARLGAFALGFGVKQTITAFFSITRRLSGTSCGEAGTSRSKALSVFTRRDERLHHFGVDEVAVELIQLCQPEIVAGVISVRPRVRIAAQISEELHQHKRPVEFLCVQR